jgi:plasmid maintenance system killer protein
MNEDSVEILVQKEIKLLPAEFNDLKRFFIKPEKVRYETLNGNRIDLWKIFQNEEYHIVFSDQRSIFGIAFTNILNDFVYLGGSGSLEDALIAYIEKDANY